MHTENPAEPRVSTHRQKVRDTRTVQSRLDSGGSGACFQKKKKGSL